MCGKILTNCFKERTDFSPSFGVGQFFGRACRGSVCLNISMVSRQKSMRGQNGRQYDRGLSNTTITLLSY